MDFFKESKIKETDKTRYSCDGLLKQRLDVPYLKKLVPIIGYINVLGMKLFQF